MFPYEIKVPVIFSKIFRVYGTFDSRRPVHLIRDPQLIKHIMIKDFDHFTNRHNTMEVGENFLSHSLFFMQNEKWRHMRNTLSPAFTGSKMRQMFKLILLEIEESMNFIKQKINDNSLQHEGLEFDVKDFTSRLTVNIIASTAFGFQINACKDDKNEFYLKAKRAITFTSKQQIKMLILELFPKVAEVSFIREASIIKILNMLTYIFGHYNPSVRIY